MSGFGVGAVPFDKTLFDSAYDGGIGGCAGLEVEAQSGGFDSLSRGLSETAYHNVALLEVRKVLHERIDSGGREENEHIVIERLVGPEIVAHRTIHHSLRVVQAEIIQHIGARIGMHIANRIKKFFLVVARHAGLKLGVVELAGCSEKYLSLAINDIFLEIVSNLLGGAEIFHCVGDADAHLLAQTEKMIYRSLSSENNSCKIVDIDFLLSELL